MAETVVYVNHRGFVFRGTGGTGTEWLLKQGGVNRGKNYLEAAYPDKSTFANYAFPVRGVLLVFKLRLPERCVGPVIKTRSLIKWLLFEVVAVMWEHASARRGNLYDGATLRENKAQNTTCMYVCVCIYMCVCVYV
jgi:hypothetical protein